MQKEKRQNFVQVHASIESNKMTFTKLIRYFGDKSNWPCNRCNRLKGDWPQDYNQGSDCECGHGISKQ